METIFDNSFLFRIKKVLFEQFQLLGQPYNKYYIDYLSILTNYEYPCMSLIFLGDTCSGKTTLINAIVAYLILEDQKTISTRDKLAEVRQSYLNYQILKPAITENTFSTTIIEPSKDEYYHLKVGENDEEIVDLDKIKKYFTELDKDANEIFSYMKKPKSTDSEDVTPQMIEKEKVLDEKINRITVVQIPNIERKLKIYDIPGISGKRPKELAEKIVGDGCIIPLICYIKNLTTCEANNESILEIMNTFRKKFNDQAYLSIIFTKSDKFYRDSLKGSKYFSESNSDEMECEPVDNTPELAANFKAFESQMDSNDFIIVDYQLINPLSIFISKNSFLTNPTLKNLQNQNLKKLAIWINSIDSFFINCAEQLLEKRIKSQIKTKINEDFGVNSKLTADNINAIKNQKEIIVNQFSSQITKYIRQFPQNSASLKAYYQDIYQALMTSIKENEFLMDYYFVKSNYIKNQIPIIQPVLKSALEKDISRMIKTSILNLWKSYGSEITIKLEELLFTNEQPILGEKKSIIQTLLSKCVECISSEGIRDGVFSVAGMIRPGIRLILAGFTLVYLSADYTGLWTYVGAREDIINNMLKAFSENSAEIINTFEKFFNDRVTTITDSLIKMKEKSIIEEQLCKAIDKVQQRKHTFKPQKISTTLSGKIKYDKSLKPGVKKFFSDLFQ